MFHEILTTIRYPQCSQEISKAEQRSATEIDQWNQRAKKTSTTTNRVVASITPAMIRRILLKLKPSDISSQSYFSFGITLFPILL
jgi:hypothetical protein